jgi:hypothetical protein
VENIYVRHRGEVKNLRLPQPIRRVPNGPTLSRQRTLLKRSTLFVVKSFNACSGNPRYM